MTYNKSSFLVLLFAATFGAKPFTCLAASYTSIATGDAFVAAGPTGNLKANNYGGGGALAVAAGNLPNGEFQSVIRFDLSGARASLDAQYGAGQWSLQSVGLQLTSSPHNNTIYNDIAAGSFGISLMQNTSWVEGTGNASNPSSTGINFNTLQSTFIGPGDQALGTFNFDGSSTGVNIYDLNLSSALSSAIMSGNVASFRLYAADSSVSYLFSSRAMQPPNQPELLITAVPEPTIIGLAALASGILLFSRSSRGRKTA